MLSRLKSILSFTISKSRKTGRLKNTSNNNKQQRTNVQVISGGVLQPAQRVLEVPVLDQVGDVRVTSGPQRVHLILRGQHQQRKGRVGGEGDAAAVEESEELDEDELTLFCLLQFELLSRQQR